MAVAAVTTEPLEEPHPMSFHPPLATPPHRRRLPAGRPREWYVSHNRRLKAMRLAIALLDSGVYQPSSAGNRRIRLTAERLGVHPPSDTTCRMVRALIRYGR
ncbi:hypothetical protein EES43_07100 [Streptomyces sp. ADI96-02]|uniref:hypothetical protein n=1 Tax=Streptomyces sp. ADI96-02 TaxID=1522760 RepID=UPI000F554D4C|nr:hypothetical protein [Streptomyces sp. ADI96-02]RPK65830.1 hypothetical protein EES43_07100 [Streptomyces sp. ADI96-02]